MATIADVARIARQAGQAGKEGGQTIVIGGVTFNLRERGYCARFVRICHEAASGLRPFEWPFAAANARQMEQKLRANGKGVDDPLPGDVVALNHNTGSNGHIGIYLGSGKFAENTSSTVRGPGTTISNLAQMSGRVTGYYRALPVAAQVKVVELPSSTVLGLIDAPSDPDGEYELVNHVGDQGKIYIRKRTHLPGT